jgi:hypothetical protein
MFIDDDIEFWNQIYDPREKSIRNIIFARDHIFFSLGIIFFFSWDHKFDFIIDSILSVN